ncbi:hypothetical protein IWW38_000675 [Coemansia aciculifera]|uniref:Uncharacterized protein n=1 Tax=Coemansia aciculifera TaxID=417176 RepID=A0ACC1M8E0_9FUNG|nr:hypothetical protein IWW38_000675 [Coemansia aciculifera]
MKLSAAFIAIATLAGVSVNAQSQCSSSPLRKEIRSLSPQEWARVSGVVRAMQNSGWFGWFAFLHDQNFNTIHGNEFFFPFHRRFVRDFESVAQQVDSQFVLPYWDELRDYANPSGSTVLTGNYVGTNGQGGNCVRDGLQNNWYMSFPNNHCLQRQYNGGNRINSWYSPEYIQSILSRSTRMSQLRPAIEFSLHGSIHLAIGGDMVQTYSPNDFIFWLHHANIDRIWSVWQTMNPNQNFWSMDGVDSNGRPMGYGTLIPHYNEPVINQMRLGVNNMCFFYDNGGSVSSRSLKIQKRDATGQKCIPRPPVAIPALVGGVFNNVNAVPVPADAYVQTTIAQKLPAPVLNKWFPTYTPGVGLNNTAVVTAPETPYTAIKIPEMPYSAVNNPSTPLYSSVPPYYTYSYSDNMAASSSAGSSSGGSSANNGYSTYGSSVYDYSSSVGSSSASNGYSTNSNSYMTSNEEGSEVSLESSNSGSYHTSNSGSYQSSNSASQYSSNASSSNIYTSSPQPSNSASSSAVYSSVYHEFDSASVPQGSPKYPMPNPFPMAESFIKMHNYPASEISKMYAIAQEFVHDMNAAGYQSPFAKGASA